MSYRVGQGFDVHRLEPGRKLVLGGVEIPFELGLAGHSDADVLLHALMNAILGAVGRGDIGTHFPDTDPRYEGTSSELLTLKVLDLMRQDGFSVVNSDLTVIAQRPRLAPFFPEMRERLGRLLHVAQDAVNLKAATTEGLGAIGTGQGIAALAVVLLHKDTG